MVDRRDSFNLPPPPPPPPPVGPSLPIRYSQGHRDRSRDRSSSPRSDPRSGRYRHDGLGRDDYRRDERRPVDDYHEQRRPIYRDDIPERSDRYDRDYYNYTAPAPSSRYERHPERSTSRYDDRYDSRYDRLDNHSDSRYDNHYEERREERRDDRRNDYRDERRDDRYDLHREDRYEDRRVDRFDDRQNDHYNNHREDRYEDRRVERYPDRREDRRYTSYYAPQRPRFRRHIDRGTEEDRRESSTLFVGNLPYEFQKHDVIQLFEDYGLLKNVTVPIDSTTSKNKGFAFVEFEDRRDAELAYDRMKDFSVKRRRLKIDWDIGLAKKDGHRGPRRASARSPSPPPPPPPPPPPGPPVRDRSRELSPYHSVPPGPRRISMDVYRR